MGLQDLLNKWNIKCDINTILSMWNESHRHWHTLDHLNDLINQINERKSMYSEKQYEKLIITSIFHDCIYDPMRSDNEEMSANFFIECCSNKEDSDIKEIEQMILDTKSHKSNTNLSEDFNKFDMDIVERDFEDLLEWEKGISEEFSGYGDKYKEGKLSFLESILDKYPNNTENILKLIDYVKNESMIYEELLNICKNRKWPTLKTNRGRYDYSDLYFIYDLKKEERGKYLNTWFIGAHSSKKEMVYLDEMITLKKVDKSTADRLYRKDYNSITINILCPIGAKFKQNNNGELLYEMKAQIHSIDDSQFGIWWSYYYGSEQTFDKFVEIRNKIMEWINAFPIINGDEFLEMCVSLGASEDSKDYN